MTTMHMERLPGLVALTHKLTGLRAAYDSQLESWTQQRQLTLGAVGLLVSYNNGVAAQLDLIDRSTANTHEMIAVVDRMQQAIDQEVTAIRDMLTARPWYTELLSIGPGIRTNWDVITPEEGSELAARLAVNLSWHHPCLVINAMNPNIVRAAGSSTQLYLADTDPAVLAQATTLFNVGLANSGVRCYVLKDFDNMQLDPLPQEQFGVVIAWNIMERLTLPLIMDNLRRIQRLLRPGGHILFSINDCNTVQGATWASQDPPSKSYATRADMESIAQTLGMTVSSYKNTVAGVALVEMELPGELVSYKSAAGRAVIRRY